MDSELIKEYHNLLNDVGTTENTVQSFLEKNTELIPLPVLENHHLHMGAVISKFKLGAEAVTDFAYLTKSSVLWKLVLIELESPHKRIFKSGNDKIEFSADFNNAMDQIRSWKLYIDGHKDIILNQIEKLRVPLEDNKVVFEYVLIIGRRNEIENSSKRRSMFAQKEEDEKVHIMTYDSLESRYSSFSDVDMEKIVLSPWRTQGFSIKELPKRRIETSLFSYLYYDFLQLSEAQEIRLIDQGYQIDEWKKGKLLVTNGREPDIDIRKIMARMNK